MCRCAYGNCGSPVIRITNGQKSTVSGEKGRSCGRWTRRRTREPCQEPDPAFAVFRSSGLCVVGRGFGFSLGVAWGAVEEGMGCLQGVYEEWDVGWALRSAGDRGYHR